MGRAAKQSFACNRVRFLAARPPITGRRPTGCRSITATPILAVPAQSSSMCPAPRRPPWWLHWARMAMPTCSIETILVASARPWRQSHVGSGSIIQAAATYRTAQGTYVVFRASSSTLTAFRITATNPPTIATGWSVSQSGRGSPFVTSTDGTNNVDRVGSRFRRRSTLARLQW